MTSSISITLFAGLLGLAWLARTKLVPIYTSSIVRLRGPPSPSVLYGNFKQLGKVADPALLQAWMAEYGPTFLARLFVLMPCLWTADPCAINHILAQSSKYYKPRDGRKQAGKVLGESSLIIVEGEAHKRMRKVMNPAFGPTQIRELTSIFVEKATQLRDYWRAAMAQEGGTLTVNIIADLSKTTLDIIGLAGFDHDLDSLSPGSERKELNVAIRHLFTKPPTMNVFHVLLDYFPSCFNFFPDERLRNLIEAQKVMHRVARELIADKKAAIKETSTEGGRSDVHGRDLLTLLIKANMAADISEDQRLSDEEVLSQIPTFLLAGHETTSVGTTWALYALSKSPRIQRKLREELLSVPTDDPTMEELNALPYLDHFVHETLRLYPPVTMTLRAPNEDDIVPLGEPIIDKQGNVLHELPISKGTRIVIPILSVNRSKTIWGDDALEFKPERWDNLPESVSSVPGIWGHILTFLGGPHGCIGYRFSITELKALLFALLRAFDFELAVPHEDIIPMGLLVQRPVVRGEVEKGSQMPMNIRPYQAL